MVTKFGNTPGAPHVDDSPPVKLLLLTFLQRHMGCCKTHSSVPKKLVSH